MKAYTIQKINYFFSPVVNRYFPKDSSTTLEGFKNKQKALEKAQELNIETFKSICKENKICKYIPDFDNLTNFQKEFIKDNNLIIEDKFLSKLNKNIIINFINTFNINFYSINEIEIQ